MAGKQVFFSRSADANVRPRHEVTDCFLCDSKPGRPSSDSQIVDAFLCDATVQWPGKTWPSRIASELGTNLSADWPKQGEHSWQLSSDYAKHGRHRPLVRRAPFTRAVENGTGSWTERGAIHFVHSDFRCHSILRVMRNANLTLTL